MFRLEDWDWIDGERLAGLVVFGGVVGFFIVSIYGAVADLDGSRSLFSGMSALGLLSLLVALGAAHEEGWFERGEESRGAGWLRRVALAPLVAIASLLAWTIAFVAANILLAVVVGLAVGVGLLVRALVG